MAYEGTLEMLDKLAAGCEADVPLYVCSLASVAARIIREQDAELERRGSAPSRCAAYPDDNPKTVHGVKKPPLNLIPPVAKTELAGAMALGAEKYGPFNWREKRVSASIYKAAAERHLDAFWDGEDYDPESHMHHLGHAMACCAILLDAHYNDMLNDDRPVRGAAVVSHKAYEARQNLRKMAGQE